MADAIISALGPATSLNLNDLIELEQGTPPTNSSKKGTLQQVKDLIVPVAAPLTVTTVGVVAGVVTLDLAVSRNFIVNLTANVTGLTLNNIPASGVVDLDIDFVQDATGGRTVTFPVSFKALGGSDTVVDAAANKVTVLSAKTKDSGTTWRYAMQESA